MMPIHGMTQVHKYVEYSIYLFYFILFRYDDMDYDQDNFDDLDFFSDADDDEMQPAGFVNGRQVFLG